MNMTLFVVLFIVTFILGMIYVLRTIISDNEVPKEKQIAEEKDVNYIKPQFKALTPEQIENIHSRGKITPEEKLKEWIEMDICAPGDAIGSAAWRCKKFKCCRDCLVDYANTYDEYTSFFDALKESYENQSVEEINIYAKKLEH